MTSGGLVGWDVLIVGEAGTVYSWITSHATYVVGLADRQANEVSLSSWGSET